MGLIDQMETSQVCSNRQTRKASDFDSPTMYPVPGNCRHATPLLFRAKGTVPPTWYAGDQTFAQMALALTRKQGSARISLRSKWPHIKRNESPHCSG